MSPGIDAMKIIKKQLALPMIASLALLLGGNAHAAKFGVHVVSADGSPVAGAAVCIGTHGNYKQFGAFFTSSDGDVMVDVPAVPLVVTVSKNRFTGLRMTEPARRFNLVKEVKLLDGVPGPRCRADSAMAQVTGSEGAAGKLKINNVNVRDGVYSVSLQPLIDGQPSHYRVSENSSFRGADWKTFSSSINLEPNLIDSSAVYLQVRRYKSVAGAAIEAHSNVVRVSL